ncbi:hypothetical protein N5B55_05195 [Ralstonia pickettii]|uniref:hypothetical protein n=1 Tax=Ralstonia pickettii TaxID=329 RepID=UPI00271494DD|nr:hypothetical protein [Ralstonia pickettii]WKZ86351.1 hypothetical protein N5B55_05195 [Ralstonia pickettii]
MTASLTLRQTKGIDLTFAELDNNFLFLRDTKMTVFNVEANGAHHMDETGYSSTDATPAIQQTIDAASQFALNGKNWAGLSRYGAVVYVSAARWQLRTQLVVKPGVILVCDGVLWNNMADQFSPAVVFQARSHCRRLLLNANGRGGVEFGENNVASDMRIGEVRVWNTGSLSDGVLGPQTAARFKGSAFEVDTLTLDGGATALDLRTASNVLIRDVLLKEPLVGFRIAGAQGIDIHNVRLESVSTLGGAIDSSNNLRIGKIVATNDDSRVSAPCASGYLLKIGDDSADSSVEGLDIGLLQATNTGGTALKVANVKHSHVRIAVTKAKLPSGNGHPIVNALEYGTGIDTLHIDGMIDQGINPFVGDKQGTLMFANGKAVVGAGTGVDTFPYNVPNVAAGGIHAVDLGPLLEAFTKRTLIFQFVGVTTGTADDYRIELVEVDSKGGETVVYATTTIEGAHRDARPFTIDKMADTNGIRFKFYNMSTNAITTAVVKLVVTGV